MKVCIIGDKSKVPFDTHGCPNCPHPDLIGPATSGSANVFVNGQPVVRIGDSGIHAACCSSNTWVALTGSATVLVNGRPIHRKGDKDIHCGGLGEMVEGSGNVKAGGPSATAGLSVEELLEALGKGTLEGLTWLAESLADPGILGGLGMGVLQGLNQMLQQQQDPDCQDGKHQDEIKCNPHPDPPHEGPKPPFTPPPATGTADVSKPWYEDAIDWAEQARQDANNAVDDAGEWLGDQLPDPNQEPPFPLPFPGRGPVRCWIAAAIYGSNSVEFFCARAWIAAGWQGLVADSFRRIYIFLGPKLAPYVQRHRSLRALLRPFFDQAVLRGARFLLTVK